MEATIVFEKIWDAMHEKNPDGSNRYNCIVLEGSSRSSKTYSILQAIYLYSFENKGLRTTVWRDTKKMCADTVLHDMKKAYRTFKKYEHVIFNKTEKRYNFPTECEIAIEGTDEEERVHGYEGALTWLNEPYKIGYETYNQLDMRTQDIMIIDWNPKKAHWIDTVKKDPKTLVIHSTYKDNPFCPPKEKYKIESYQPVKYSIAVLSGRLSELDAKKYDIENNPLLLTPGELNELARCIENERKGSASDFNWNVYGLGLKAEKPNRIFKWNEISDDEYNALDAREYVGVDWGAVDPMGILKAKYYDGCLYLHELNYQSENEIKMGLDPIFLESLLTNEDEGLIKWLFTKLDIDKNSIIVCDNNRPNKIKALRKIGFEYAIAAIKGKIIDGIDLLNGLKVYYTRSSANLAYEQENYSREVDRYGIILEEAEDDNNHLMDPARYVAEFLQKQGIINKV